VVWDLLARQLTAEDQPIDSAKKNLAGSEAGISKRANCSCVRGQGV
jgi:hypothetical protein